MRIAWVSHQWPRADDAPAIPGLLPGRYAGGAEMLQDLMRRRLELDYIPVDPTADPDLTGLEDADRVVVSGLVALSPAQLARIAPLRPLVWTMTARELVPAILPILEAASPLVYASPELRSWVPWAPDGHYCSGWIDTTEIPDRTRTDLDALWAARDHPLKGRIAARVWALRHDRTLTEMTGAPRSDVLTAMSRARTFVHLPYERDPCPTTVVEAELAGCEIVVNGRVGRVPVRGRDAVAEWIEGLPARFSSWLDRSETANG